MGLPIEIRGLRTEDWPWVREKRARSIVCTDTDGVVAVQGEKILGAIVLDGFVGACCNCHIAIDNPMVLRRGILQFAAQFVFEIKQMDVVLGYTASNRLKALRFYKKLGWKEVHRVKDGEMKGVDYVLLELRRKDCWWWIDSKVKRAA